MPKVLLIIVAAVITAMLCVCISIIMKRNKTPFARIISKTLFFAGLYSAWLLKLNYETAAVSVYTPFYKIFEISEYGYTAVLNDLLRYAGPFAIAGFFYMAAFPGVGIIGSLITGIIVSLLFNLKQIITGQPFITDEYLLAGIGMAVGTGLYVIIARLIQKTPVFNRLMIAVPNKGKGIASWIICSAVYLGIALILIIDFGKGYADLSLFKSDVPLPNDITLSIGLDKSGSIEGIYAYHSRSTVEAVGELRDELIPDGTISYADWGGYTVTDEYASLSYAADHSWVYTLNSISDNSEILSAQQADELVRTFFKNNDLITTELYEQTDCIKAESDDGSICGYDMYYITACDGAPVLNNNRITVSVRGSEITRIRKDGPDLVLEAKKHIISQNEAYSRLINGGGAYTLFLEAVSAEFTDCNLGYMVNSQGYYLPVWYFTASAVLADGGVSEFEAYVPALK